MRKLGPRDLISLTKFILITGGRSMLSSHVCRTPNTMIISVPETPFEWEARKWERSPLLQEAVWMTCGAVGARRHKCGSQVTLLSRAFFSRSSTSIQSSIKLIGLKYACGWNGLPFPHPSSQIPFSRSAKYRLTS